jgi:hypothetical protein
MQSGVRTQRTGAGIKCNVQIQSNIAINKEEQLSAAGIFLYTSGNPTLQYRWWPGVVAKVSG